MKTLWWVRISLINAYIIWFRTHGFHHINEQQGRGTDKQAHSGVYIIQWCYHQFCQECTRYANESLNMVIFKINTVMVEGIGVNVDKQM